MIALLLSCLLSLPTLAAAEPPAVDPNAPDADGAYAMNDVGGGIILPAGWEMQEWSDWNFKAKTADGVLMRLYLTPFQVQPDEAAARAWAGIYKERLEEEGANDFKDPVLSVQTVKLRDEEVQAARVDLDFNFEKQNTRGVLHAAALVSDGQVVHVETLAAARNDKKAQAALSSLLGGLALTKKPSPAGPARVETPAAFALTAPPGWRTPLLSELSGTRRVSGKVGEAELDPERCVTFIRPPAVGDPDVIFACDYYKHLSVLDEYSFEGVEGEVHEMFFGRAETPVEKATQIQMGDRVGLLYKPPVAGMPVRLAIAPYDKGMVVMWAMANQLDEAGLDAAVQAILPTVEFTGPGGGAPIVALDKRLSYYLSYRPTSPIVLGPAALLVVLVGGGLAIARRRKPKYED